MSQGPPPYGKGFHKPLRVAVLFSGGASSGKAMLEDPEHGKKYHIVVAGTDRPKGAKEKGVRMFREADIPVLDGLETSDGRKTSSSRRFFYGPSGRNHTVMGMGKRVAEHPEYWEAWVKALEPYGVDMVALSGLMILAEKPFLGEYRNRILNVHPAALHILGGCRVDRLDMTGIDMETAGMIAKKNRLKRKFKGEDAVYDAVVAGEPETRSTVHFLDDDPEEYDEGVIAVESKPFEVDRKWVYGKLAKEDEEAVRQYCSELQEMMKWEGDGPAFTFALRAMADGDLRWEGKCLLYKGQPLPYQGFQLPE